MPAKVELRVAEGESLKEIEGPPTKYSFALIPV